MFRRTTHGVSTASRAQRLALFLCLAVLAVLAFGTQAALAVTHDITGTVTEAGTSTGIENVCVNVWTVGPLDTKEQVDSTTTDADGNYTLSENPATYKLDFEDCGTTDGDFVTQWWSNKISFNTANPIDVSGGNAVANASLSHGGQISGVVKDTSNTALEGVCVEAIPASGDSSFTVDANTDPTGHYTLTNVRPGAYKVQYSDCGVDEYEAQFYNARTGQSSGDAVHVTAGETAALQEVDLQKGGAIEGTLTDAGGAHPALNHICVTAEPTNGSVPFGGSTETDSSGHYRIAGLRTGSYNVIFSDNGCGGDGSFLEGPSSHNPVAVTVGQTHTIGTDQMTRGGEIDGNVKDDTNANLHFACVDAVKDGVEVANALTDSNGNYALVGLPTDTYKIFVQPCSAPGSLQTRYFNSGDIHGSTTEAAGTGVAVTQGTAAVTGKDIKLPNGGQIQGHVTNHSGGADLGGVLVSAIGGTTGTFSEGAVTDSSGNYTIKDLNPGGYTLSFHHFGFVDQWWDNQPSQPTSPNITINDPVNTVTGKDAALAPIPNNTSSIAGHVEDASAHTALENICVSFFDAGTGDFVGDEITDSGGAFTMAGLTPDHGYKIQFSDCSEQGYVSEWWQNADSIDTATVVNAPHTPGTIGPLSANVELSKGATLSGNVIDVPGNGLGSICADLVKSDGTTLDDLSTATDEFGDWEILGVPPGTGYHVHFSNCNGGNFVPTNLSLPTVTGTSFLQHLDTTMPYGYRVPGHLDGPGGPLFSGAGCVDAVVVGQPDRRYFDETDDFGNYTIEGVPVGQQVQLTASDCGVGDLESQNRTVGPGTVAEQRIADQNFTLAPPTSGGGGGGGGGGGDGGNGGGDNNGGTTTTTTGNNGTTVGNGGTPNGPTQAAGTLAGGGGSKSAAKNGTFAVTNLTCNSSQACTGSGTGSGTLAKMVVAAKKGKKVVLASGKVSIPAGKTKALKLKLTKAALKTLKKKKHLKMTVTITLKSPGATTVTKTVTVNVKAPKKKK